MSRVRQICNTKFIDMANNMVKIVKPDGTSDIVPSSVAKKYYMELEREKKACRKGSSIRYNSNSVGKYHVINATYDGSYCLPTYIGSSSTLGGAERILSRTLRKLGYTNDVIRIFLRNNKNKDGIYAVNEKCVFRIQRK